MRLDVRDGAIESGVIVPEDPPASELVLRINSDDPEELMPPPKSNLRLSPEQKKRLERWIEEGANYAPHWAFVAPERPAVPAVKGERWVRNPIDRFVLSRLEAEGMSPSPEADRATLIKRLSIDLTGLPPTPEEVDAFVADTDPGAYEALVDRLLASPHHGERMALPWLDAARYADSNGFQQDGDTWQWVWRDWLVKALNDDMPFDQFTIRLLAGDLLPGATTEDRIASGFNRNHLLNGEGGAIAEEQRFVNLFDRIDTTATTLLGLTMACAQCHDHKYDPITQRDYYGLLDAFNRVPESGTPQRFSSRIRVAAPFVELPTEENKARIAELEARMKEAEAEGKLAADSAFEGWRLGIFADGKPADGKGLPDALAPLLRKPEGDRNDDEKKTLDAGLRKHFDDKVRPTLAAKLPALAKFDGVRKQLNDYRGDQLPRVMIMSDAKPRETAILDRGDYLRPGAKVSFATPAFLPPMPEGSPANRLGLARWLVMPEHPLTARVQVNRMWQHAFGTGIVKTSEDFGVQGEYPIHRELLDWLAVEFRDARLEHEGHASADRHQCHVSPVEPRDARASRPRPREPPVCAGEPVPDVVADLARLGARVLRPDRHPDRGPPRLSVSARRDLGGPRHHQGARLHLPGLLGQRPLSTQPLHVLAPDRRAGQHVRRLEPADLPRAVRRRPARRCTPSPRSTTRPGSRPRGPWPSGR